jgi:NET1-associated nuclear protein 1 (U3 small nucleolar RNA-associated protein 17)
MILAVRTQILVYATASSRLVRALQLDEHESITSYIISAANKNNLFVSAYSGLVVKWDWTTGEEIQRWKSSDKLVFISQQLPGHKSSQSSAFLLIHDGPNRTRRISSATFLDSSDEITNSKVVLEQPLLAPWIKLLDQGKYVVAYADDKIFLGQPTRSPEDMEAATAYTWREIVIPKSITCIDARCRGLSSNTKKKRSAVDIVVGCLDGSILIYDDIFLRVTNKVKNPKEDEIVSRRFHWHRNEVLAVKWSLDGNYIISGGHETVMVIWQLDTGQQQFLPHLSATIQSLTVSNTGSAYAVQLADNSVMVLSSSELEPTAFVCHLMLGYRSHEKQKRIPAILHHSTPDLLALAVPANSTFNPNIQAKATLLQMYDVRAQQQSQRQALVRNNITELNVDPSGAPVQEPDITHLRFSHDGKWLATVDEWTPPEHDRKLIYPLDERPGNEIFLKFWAKNEATQLWELTTKIECPHSMRTKSSTSISDLEANSRRPEFSTISCNGLIRIWAPKSRHRNGLAVTDKSGSQLYTWTCTHTIETSNPLQNSFLPSNALAYSPDGSVLAVSSNKSPVIHFINPLNGIIQHTQQGSHPGPISHLTFLNHHLITISKDLRVYNTVNGQLLYALTLNDSISTIHLAANQHDQTFAISCLLPPFMTKEEDPTTTPTHKSQILLFTLTSSTPIFQQILDHPIEILLPLPTEPGYLLVNHHAEITYLAQPGSSAAAKRRDLRLPSSEQALTALTTTTTPTMANERLRDILSGTSLAAAGSGAEAASRALPGTAADGPERQAAARITQPQQQPPSHQTQASLAEIWNHAHAAEMSVADLFHRVVAVLQGTRG